MPSIYANTTDGYVSKDDASWATARDSLAGETSSYTANYNNLGIRADRVDARGGGYLYSIGRSFFYFDISGITTNVLEAKLRIFGRTYGTGDVIAVKATSGITVLTTSDFNSISGWVIGGSDGSGGGDNLGNVTAYSQVISAWSTSGYNNITLNSTALADLRTNDTLYIAVINADYDLRDMIPTGYLDNRNGLYYVDQTGTDRDPYIDYTLADNAVFFGCNF